MEIDETSEEKCCVNIMVNDIDVLLLNKSGFVLSFIFEIVIETCIYFLQHICGLAIKSQ